MKSAVLNVPIDRQSKKQLEQLARRWGRTPGEAGAQLLEEGLRRSLFSQVEFRSTPAGRHAYITGTRLAIWQIADLLQQHGGSIEKTAQYLQCPKDHVRTAELYAQAYAGEIQGMIAENKAVTFESLSRVLPGLETSGPPSSLRSSCLCGGDGISSTAETRRAQRRPTRLKKEKRPVAEQARMQGAEPSVDWQPTWDRVAAVFHGQTVSGKPGSRIVIEGHR